MRPKPAVDPVEAYARAVLGGTIVAGPLVRAACQRHLDDLAQGAARGLRWDAAAAARVFDFFASVLRLNGGEHEGRPFVLQPWQAFIVGSLFGWKGADGSRRFRVAFVEVGKGNGKSPLAAGIGLYMLVGDGEARAEVYAAAVDRAQASILFADAVAMADQAPALDRRLRRSGGKGRVWNLAHLDSGSYFRPISSEHTGRGKSGPRPHCALLDEVHEHPSPAMLEYMRAGTKGRRQPLILLITNSGFDRSSVCWQWHELARQVVEGTSRHDHLFGYVAGLDPGDDPFTDTGCWIKSNPNLGVSIPTSYLEEQVAEARHMPLKEGLVRRLNFCQWTQGENRWFDPALWRPGAATVPDAELSGLPVTAGLDLSETRDLTALVLLFRAPDGRHHVRCRFWLPDEGLAEREVYDRIPWTTWARQGLLTTTPGPVIDHAAVAAELAGFVRGSGLRYLAYDRAKSRQFFLRLEELGIACRRVAGEDALAEAHRDRSNDLVVYDWGQGFLGMGPAIDATDRLLLDRRLCHGDHPILTMCASNVGIAVDPAGNRKFTKPASATPIDGMVALAMAAGLMALMPGKPPARSYLEREGASLVML